MPKAGLISTAIASLTLGIAFVISSAPVSQAQSFTIDCSDYGRGDTITTSANAGEELMITLVNCNVGSSPFIAPYTAGITDPEFAGVSITSSPQLVSDYSIKSDTVDGVYSNVFRLYDGLVPVAFEIYITVQVPRQPEPTSATPTSGPKPVLQQFGMTNGASCETTASPGLNWAGVRSGGWGHSWAQWMHGGQGGPVCTRTLVYSNAQGRWILAE